MEKCTNFTRTKLVKLYTFPYLLTYNLVWIDSVEMFLLVLFNHGHVLQLRSETVAIRTRMIYCLDDRVYDDHMITGD